MNVSIMMNTWVLTLSVQSKLKDSITLESSCRTWNRLLLGSNPAQLSFFHAASDTLPTPVNLKRWNIHCESKCSLCGYSQPTTAHILGNCSVALSHGHFTYCHDQVLHCLATEILKHFAGSSLCWFTWYAGKWLPPEYNSSFSAYHFISSWPTTRKPTR